MYRNFSRFSASYSPLKHTKVLTYTIVLMASLNAEEENTLRSLSVNLHARQIITIRTSNAHFHLAAFFLIIYINMTCLLHQREVLQCNKALNTAKINHTSMAFSLLQMCSRCTRYKRLVQRPTSHERPDV